MESLADATEKALNKKQRREKRDRETKEMFSAEESGVGRYQTVAAGQLRAFVERYERLEEDKKQVSDDQKELMEEVKGAGFDGKAFRHIVKLRKMEDAERQEIEAVVDLYREAVGIV